MVVATMNGHQVTTLMVVKATMKQTKMAHQLWLKTMLVLLITLPELLAKN